MFVENLNNDQIPMGVIVCTLPFNALQFQTKVETNRRRKAQTLFFTSLFALDFHSLFRSSL